MTPVTTPAPSTALIDWTLLGHILEYSIAISLATALMFVIITWGLTFVDQPGLKRIAGSMMACLSSLALVGAVAWGLFIITHKG
jgi:hypothetical protein